MIQFKFQVAYSTNPPKLLCGECKTLIKRGKIKIARVYKSSRLAQVWKHLDCLSESVKGNAKISVVIENNDLIQDDQQLLKRRIDLFIANSGKLLDDRVIMEQKLLYPQRGPNPKVIPPMTIKTRAMTRRQNSILEESIVKSKSPRKTSVSPAPPNTLLPFTINGKIKNKKGKGKARKIMEKKTKASKSRQRSTSNQARGRSGRRDNRAKSLRSKSTKRSISNQILQPKVKRKVVTKKSKSRATKVLLNRKEKPKKPRRAKSMDSSVSSSPARSQQKVKKVRKGKKKASKQKQRPGPTQAQKTQFNNLTDVYVLQTNAALKQLLANNFMKKTGTKPQLVQRIVTAIMFGYIRTCPSCGGGKPNFDFVKLQWHCKGYLDDVDFVNCHKKFNVGEVQTEKFIP